MLKAMRKGAAHKIGEFGIRRIPIIELVDTPLVGTVFIGIIDRGTNVIQVRPHTICNLSCIFCSVDAGPRSRSRGAEFVVDSYRMAKEVKEIVDFKGGGVEALIDSVGEPLIYGGLCDLIRLLKDIDGVKLVSIETHGLGLTERKIDSLARCGLDRINLSLDAVDEKVGKILTGSPAYSTGRVMEAARYAAERGLWVLLTPVWVPGYNDEEIPRLIEFAKSLPEDGNPHIVIQKYEEHRRGRRPPGVRRWSWRKFRAELEVLEGRYGVKLLLGSKDMNITKSRGLPKPYRVGEYLDLYVISPGWRLNEALAVTRRGDRLVSVVGLPRIVEGPLKARIIRNADNIYLAKPITHVR